MRAIDNVHMANLLFTASQQAEAQTETNNPKVKRQGTLCHLSLHSFFFSILRKFKAGECRKMQEAYFNVWF